MTEAFWKANDRASVQTKDTRAQPVVVRELNRLKTTHSRFNGGG
jgi:hypothetical protein